MSYQFLKKLTRLVLAHAVADFLGAERTSAGINPAKVIKFNSTRGPWINHMGNKLRAVQPAAKQLVQIVKTLPFQVMEIGSDVLTSSFSAASFPCPHYSVLPLWPAIHRPCAGRFRERRCGFGSAPPGARRSLRRQSCWRCR